jgi:hypothetical protein
MGQQVKPGWGQSDREAGQQARYADRSLTRECHQGQQDEHPAPTGRMKDCKPFRPSRRQILLFWRRPCKTFLSTLFLPPSSSKRSWNEAPA